MFTDFDGNRVTRVLGGGAVSLVRCTFDDNNLFEDDGGAAIIQADGEVDKGGMQVRLEGCTFTNNTLNALPTLLAENRGAPANATAAFFSDAEEPAVCVFEGPDLATGLPACVTTPARLLEEAGDGFLTNDTDWFEDVQQVRCIVRSLTCMQRVRAQTVFFSPVWFKHVHWWHSCCVYLPGFFVRAATVHPHLLNSCQCSHCLTRGRWGWGPMLVPHCPTHCTEVLVHSQTMFMLQGMPRSC